MTDKPRKFSPPTSNVGDAKARCVRLRKRILDISQRVTALHIASAYSCMEIVEMIYFSLMRRAHDGKSRDCFVMSKGHGCMAQYVTLEELGVLSNEDLDSYCKPHGILGTHPDYGNPGIEASTGSLGHGLSIATGIAYAHKIKGDDSSVFVVLSDGELQEGSTWEAMILASSLKLDNLFVFVDLNDLQSLGRMSELHPSVYPVAEKASAFGWEVAEADGHDSRQMQQLLSERRERKPFFMVCRTTKGKGVQFMENVPIWHYRSPSKEEYQKALRELEEGAR